MFADRKEIRAIGDGAADQDTTRAGAGAAQLRGTGVTFLHQVFPAGDEVFPGVGLGGFESGLVPGFALFAATLALNTPHWPRELGSVPIEIHNHHVYVPVTYGANARLSFLLDSGAAASLNILDRSWATKLGITVEGSGNAPAIGGKARIAFANSVDLSIPPLHLKPTRVAVMDLADGQAQEGHAVDGLLGYALFQAYIVQIDYPARRLV